MGFFFPILTVQLEASVALGNRSIISACLT
uniref:Uncharacterized protein n=1 Tax=Anguilla anguilla TaxID=7936 RepID=A0A0E9QSL9_ANGAN